jgi:hypothetical protein
MINVTAGKRFQVEGTLTGQTWLVDLIEKS